MSDESHCGEEYLLKLWHRQIHELLQALLLETEVLKCTGVVFRSGWHFPTAADMLGCLVRTDFMAASICCAVLSPKRCSTTSVLVRYSVASARWVRIDKICDLEELSFKIWDIGRKKSRTPLTKLTCGSTLVSHFLTLQLISWFDLHLVSSLSMKSSSQSYPSIRHRSSSAWCLRFRSRLCLHEVIHRDGSSYSSWQSSLPRLQG